MTPRQPAEPLRQVVLLLAACGLMSYPWLAPSLQHRSWWGVPAVLGYLFAVWGLAILWVAVEPRGE